MADVYKAGENNQNSPPTTADEMLARIGETKGNKLWGAFSVRPGKRFIDEQDDEEVILLLRAHPITNIGWILLVIMLLLFPGLLDLTNVFSLLPFKYVFIGKLVWYLITLGFAFEKFLDWYYSVFIITNERIVDIDFVNLMFRIVSYANLNHIEEPVMTMGGFIRSIFRYGDLHVSTAAEVSTIEATSIPYPDKVIRIISELAEDLEKRREKGE